MKYNVIGDRTFLASESNSNIYNDLLPITYVVKHQPDLGFFLEHASDMSVPAKIYGNPHMLADRIINTFKLRKEQTGVHLTGEKGSGKTLLTKVISKKMREEHSYPTVIVNTPFCGEGFNTFVASIDTPCMFVFDEFEKMYDDDQQQAMLTLFDGTRNSKKLFVVTTNTSYRVGEYMHNRPGRFYYHIKYDGLETDFIREYVEDTIKNRSLINTTVDFCMAFGNTLNFDMLQALLEEMNRYDEEPRKAVKMLNIKPVLVTAYYHIIEFVPSEECKGDYKFVHSKRKQLNPYTGFALEYYYEYTSGKKKGEVIGDGDYKYEQFKPTDIISIRANFITMENEAGGKIIIEKEENKNDMTYTDYM